MRHILKCCGYTISKKCDCGKKALSPNPPKYSPEDKYAEYRRKVKRKEWQQAGFL